MTAITDRPIRGRGSDGAATTRSPRRHIHQSHNHWWRLPVAVVAGSAVLVAAVATSVLWRPSASPSPATRTARAFLDRYVMGDGRVARIDQGGDTVSEGQAYALLLAAA